MGTGKGENRGTSATFNFFRPCPSSRRRMDNRLDAQSVTDVMCSKRYDVCAILTQFCSYNHLMSTLMRGECIEHRRTGGKRETSEV